MVEHDIYLIEDAPALRVYRCHPDAILPSRQSAEAVGYDIHSLEDFTLRPGSGIVVRTGLVVQPPPGYHTEILIRSSMAYKHGIMLRNSVGLIDRDYAGPEDELMIMMYRVADISRPSRRSQSPVGFVKGDRIAQLVLRKTYNLPVVEVPEAPAANRGGLGSTGK